MEQAPLNVLIIEDNSGDALLEEIALAEQDFPSIVHRSINGDEAIAHLGAAPVDLVLLDGILDGEPGLEVLRRIKTDSVRPDVPVVIVTGSERQRDREEFLANGAAASLYKRTTFEELVSELGALKRFT
ncbi:hypothetical protein MTBLM5_90037 [Magnetospirillum sp. LM-5]|uniref:response regulator n=1 Tax=Magnetospirillum sp. LM-5 TaxID=2681466 RepID=UPI001381D1FC|nr:response regulator [Magnetospirillum sp. LM-5]CAA7625815.1 hypothetical protein MTBLM5_90037 [Magnetospirillum sp. LM-5]